MDSAVEKAKRLIATYQFESQRADGEHAAEIVEVARALLSSHSQLERMREALEEILKEDPHGFGVPLGSRLHALARAALTKEEK